MMFGNRRYFRELLHNSVEGIASNILANWLQRLVDKGLISRAKDPAQQAEDPLQPQRAGHPTRVDHGAPGRMGTPAPAGNARARHPRGVPLGGPELWQRFMDELREQHLGIARPPGTESALAQLQAAYEAELVARGTRPQRGSKASRSGAIGAPLAARPHHRDDARAELEDHRPARLVR